MKFQDYLIESWKDYKLSKSPKVLLYDFYLLSYISSLILDPGTRKDVGLTGVGYSGKFFGREGKELDLDIQNAQRKLLPFLGTKLSQALFIAVTSELRHVLDRNQKWFDFKHVENKTFKNYIRNLRLMSDKELSPFHPTRNLEQPELAVETTGRKISYQAAKKAIKETGGNVVDFARMAKDAFKDLNWSAAYGGPAWAAIAQGYIELRQALDNYNPEAPSPSSESAENLIAAIDHAFDLEHNTGTVLNKVNYFDVDGYAWIKQALDDKRDSDMYVIASKASSDMRKLGHEVLKVAGMQDRQLKQVPATAGIPKKQRRDSDLSDFGAIDVPTDYSEGKFKVGDKVKLIYHFNKEGIVKKIANGGDYNIVQVELTKSPNEDEIGHLNWYGEDILEKSSESVKKVDSGELQVGDIVKFKKNEVYGVIKRLGNHDNTMFYEVEVIASNDPKVTIGQKLTTVASGVRKASSNEKEWGIGDLVKLKDEKYNIYGNIVKIYGNLDKKLYDIIITDSNSPKIRVGKTYTTTYDGFEKPGSSNKPIKLKGFSAAYADLPPPRERRDTNTIKPGNYFVIDNEDFLVQITKVKENSIFYKVLATSKPYKYLEGMDVEKPKDVFIDNILFMVNKENIQEYIRHFKKKR